MISPAAQAAAPVASVRVLLRRVVDYAGLFPPASLGMAAAVAEYAEHRAGEHAWALGRFVVPAARLEEFDDAAGDRLPTDGANSWALSALLSGEVEEDIRRVERFNDLHRDVRAGAVMVDTVELKTVTPREVARAAEMLDRRFDTYMEVPVGEEPSELLTAIAKTVAKAKIRTGGVTPDAFPSSFHVVRFIAGCLAHDVGFKATAGLHHPWRSEYHLTYAADAPRATMFGFLNLMLATAALRAGWSEPDTTGLLEERDASAVRFATDGVTWRGRELGMDAITRSRDSLASFGSCSFRDPVTELQASALL